MNNDMRVEEEGNLLTEIRGIKTMMREVLKKVTAIPKPDDRLSTEEACAYLKIKRPTLYEKTSHHEISYIKQGKNNVFLRSDLDAWQAGRRIASDDEIAARAGAMDGRRTCQ